MAVVRKLNGMIRNAEKLRVNVRIDNQPFHLEVTKQSALAAVAQRWPDGGETGMSVNEDGFLYNEANPNPV